MEFVIFFIFVEIGHYQKRISYPLLLIPLLFWTLQGIRISSLENHFTNDTQRFTTLMSKQKTMLLLTENVTTIASAYFSNVNLVGPWVYLHTLAGILKEKDNIGIYKNFITNR